MAASMSLALQRLTCRASAIDGERLVQSTAEVKSSAGRVAPIVGVAVRIGLCSLAHCYGVDATSICCGVTS